MINRRVTSSLYTCAPLYTLLRVKQERVRHDSNFIPLICVEESFFNGVKENFFLSLSAPLPVELSFREENGSTRLENKQSHNFSPSTFPKTFVRLRVILCNASHRSDLGQYINFTVLRYRPPSIHIPPEHPQLRGSVSFLFSSIFVFAG